MSWNLSWESLILDLKSLESILISKWSLITGYSVFYCTDLPSTRGNGPQTVWYRALPLTLRGFWGTAVSGLLILCCSTPTLASFFMRSLPFCCGPRAKSFIMQRKSSSWGYEQGFITVGQRCQETCLFKVRIFRRLLYCHDIINQCKCCYLAIFNHPLP